MVTKHNLTINIFSNIGSGISSRIFHEKKARKRKQTS